MHHVRHRQPHQPLSPARLRRAPLALLAASPGLAEETRTRAAARQATSFGCQRRTAPLAEAYAKRFTGKYAYHLVSGGIGHNRPQEAPEAFVNAVLDAEHL